MELGQGQLNLVCTCLMQIMYMFNAARKHTKLQGNKHIRMSMDKGLFSLTLSHTHTHTHTHTHSHIIHTQERKKNRKKKDHNPKKAIKAAQKKQYLGVDKEFITPEHRTVPQDVQQFSESAKSSPGHTSEQFAQGNGNCLH